MQVGSKQRAVIDALERIGGIAHAESIVGSTVTSKAEYGYRNKVELVTDPSSSRPRLGFHQARSDAVVPIESCLLLPKKHQKAPRALGGALRYLAGESDLGLTRVGYRVAVNTTDVEVALWTSPGAFPRNAVAKTLRQAVPASSVVRVLTKGPSQERAVSGVEALAGRGNWHERLGDLEYTVSAPSFFQVNSRVAARMIDLVLEILQPDGSDRALDLYAGAGTFTLPLAELAGDVVAVESSGPAVKDLRRNLESNQLWAEVVGGDAAREISTLGHFDLAVVDPPRCGLLPEVIAPLAATRPRALAYVSCDPATLARDCKALFAAGYELVSATPVDLFPQTYHVETVAHFRPVR
jgi:23S rRNA (uracil1939-C5)-methyltransferase